jgi:hypothetical protein
MHFNERSIPACDIVLSASRFYVNLVLDIWFAVFVVLDNRVFDLCDWNAMLPRALWVKFVTFGF